MNTLACCLDRSIDEVLANPPRFDFWVMMSDGSGKRRLTRFSDLGVPDHRSMVGEVGALGFRLGS